VPPPAGSGVAREPRGGYPDPVRLAGLVHAGLLDAELAALLWLLVEARVPIMVAGDAAARETIRDVLTPLLPATAPRRRLAGPDERFRWMPEAAALGWRSDPAGAGAPGGHAGDGPVARAMDAEATSPGQAAAETGTVLIADLDPDSELPTWGERARVVVRSLSIGYGLLATGTGARLEEVLGRLAMPPVAALDDELARLGVVLIAGMDAAGRGRVVAAHYLRPVARDVQGHVQRLPPAVLATWAPASGRFEHFAWGILDELAGRAGLTPIELEREQARRMELLARLAGQTEHT
jgi:hypothetical protein